jgi:hypothetical protein
MLEEIALVDGTQVSAVLARAAPGYLKALAPRRRARSSTSCGRCVFASWTARLNR